ncbi:acyltransferase family protein [Streptomyces sp. B6B3]|uniref:acyltransferase family protein n=1 Tax=Streptomyces sp. B6B3 TaxID=3153570 RepID=UPI00325F94B1
MTESDGPGTRLDVQGLRAVAVVLVVVSHAGVGWLRGGYVGVDVFFVVSGFVITASLTRELAGTGRVSLRRFYARRVLRLLPAATLVALTTLAGTWLFLSKVRFTEYAGDALASALYGMNARLASAGTDYLDEGQPPSPFQHFWSLAVEEQFYLGWPLLLAGSWWLARGRRRWVAVAPLAVCATSFGLSVATTADAASWAYFGPHTRIWELGAGALLALGADRLARLPAAVAGPLTWVGLTGVLAAAVWFDEATPFPGHHALLPVLGTAAVIAGGCAPAGGGAGLLLGRRPAVWLGGLSYGWYLWHWPALLIGPAALGRPAGVALSLPLCAAALGLAWLTLRLVEDPVRFHPVLRRRPRRALGLGFGLSAGAAALAVTASAFPPQIASGGAATALNDVVATAPDPERRLTELLATAESRVPSNLSPALHEVRGVRSAVYEDECHVGRSGTETPTCVYGDPDAERTVVLFGDSHAAQWFPALDRIARERGWRLVSLTKASCKLAAVTTIKEGEPYEACDEWRAAALDDIAELRPALVLASSSDDGALAEPVDDPAAEWSAGYRETFRALAGAAGEVAVILDTPWPTGDPVDCAARHPLRLERCTNELPHALRNVAQREWTAGAARAAGATVIDPLPWFCAPAGTCPVVVADTLVYRDDNHLNDAYAAALAPVLGARLAELPGASGFWTAGHRGISSSR